MRLLQQIEKYLDPKRYNLPFFIWNSLILNSRIRFHSFFRHAENLEQEEHLALSEYNFKKNDFISYPATIVKYFILKTTFNKRKNELLKKLKSKQIVLLKTICLSTSLKDGKYKDPFFHSFVDRLESERNYLIIFDPMMNLQLSKKYADITYLNMLPWFSFLNFSDAIRAMFFQIRYYIFFGKINNSWDKELKQELIHPTTFHHLLFYFAFQRISKTFNVKRLILTFENNSWEKVLMQSYRENSPETLIVGYQHSVVPESTLGMRYLPWEIQTKNIPDLIYTTGLETQNILRSFNPGLPIKIEALCALRYEYLYSMRQKNQALKKNILVAVDAIAEASDLINLVLEEKDYFVNNNFNITFRFHPAMKYEFFKKLIDHDKLESFAKVSTSSLDFDIDYNDCIIYWGSTVALEGNFVGNSLIHFHSHFPLSHDPLFKCEHLKTVIKDSEEMKKALNGIYKLDLETINTERNAAREYIKNYFYKPTPHDLDKLLGHTL